MGSGSFKRGLGLISGRFRADPYNARTLWLFLQSVVGYIGRAARALLFGNSHTCSCVLNCGLMSVVVSSLRNEMGVSKNHRKVAP